MKLNQNEREVDIKLQLLGHRAKSFTKDAFISICPVNLNLNKHGGKKWI